MITGIGTDIVAVARMADAWQRHGERLLERVLAPDEIRAFRSSANRAAFLARRFAAKEAAAKALGTGISEGIALRDLEVVHDERGRPALAFHRKAAERAQRLGVEHAQLSISDEQAYAIAFVVLLTTEPPSRDCGERG